GIKGFWGSLNGRRGPFFGFLRVNVFCPRVPGAGVPGAAFPGAGFPAPVPATAQLDGGIRPAFREIGKRLLLARNARPWLCIVRLVGRPWPNFTFSPWCMEYAPSPFTLTLQPR